MEKKRRKDGEKKMDGAQEMESRKKKRLASNVRMNISLKRYMQKKRRRRVNCRRRSGLLIIVFLMFLSNSDFSPDFPKTGPALENDNITSIESGARPNAIIVYTAILCATFVRA